MKLFLKENKIMFNSVTGIANRLITFILGFIFRKVFILYLGESLSGLSSLYTNILNFLNLATAGLGVNALYKIYICNAENNYEEIKKIEVFTKYFFRAVSILIFMIGVGFSFFLNSMIYESQYDIGFLRLVFLLQVLSESVNHWFYSKRIMLQANEKIYVISFVELLINTSIYIVQICIIIFTQNYILYLFTLIIKYFLIGFFIYLKAIKDFPYLKDPVTIKIREMLYLFKDLKDTIFMQISSFVFLSTDSLVLSKFLGLVTVNSYDNYIIICNSVTTVMDEINGSFRSTFGNRLAKDSSIEAQEQFVISATFTQYLIAVFCSCSLYSLMSPFIALWLGSKYILSNQIALLFTVNIFVTTLASPLKDFMLIKGNFSTDKKITFAAAIVNLTISIILVQKIGIAGVICGTLLGNILMYITRFYLFFNKYIQKNMGKYIIQVLIYVLCFSFILGIMAFICSRVTYFNQYINFILKVMLCVLVPNLLNICIFYKHPQIIKIRNYIKKFVL